VSTTHELWPVARMRTDRPRALGQELHAGRVAVALEDPHWLDAGAGDAQHPPRSHDRMARFAVAVATVLTRFSSEDVSLAVEHGSASGPTRACVPVVIALGSDDPVQDLVAGVVSAMRDAIAGDDTSNGRRDATPACLHAAVLAGPAEGRARGRRRHLRDAGLPSADDVDCCFALCDREVELAFDRNLFDDERMRVVLDCLDQVIAQLSAAARAGAHRTRPSEIAVVSARLRDRMLHEFQGAAVPLTDERTVIDLVEARAREAGDRTALRFGEQELTYERLVATVHRLAAELRRRGVRKGDYLALMLGNSLELPVAMLAAMRIGAVFVPMDDGWPPERMRTILQAVGPRLVVLGPRSRRGVAGDLEAFEVDVAQAPGAEPAPASTSWPELALSDLIYGFCTSGSTGEPKCALNLHGGIVNRFHYMTRRFESDAREVVLQNSAPVFDSSIWQLLWPLTNGATVVVPLPRAHLDLERTIAEIERNAVTMTDFVPSVFNALVAHLQGNPADAPRLRSLRHLLIGGEEISGPSCRRFAEMLPHVTLTNTYGPTEASIGMVFHEVSPDEHVIPIGRPIDNTCAVVLDGRLALVPPGQAGQLYIGGACLGAGYLSNAAGAQAAWVPNPLRGSLPGSHLYATGDIVHQDAGGKLYFLGRRDAQVKVGGVRIELGEIEQALFAHRDVCAAAVTVEPRGASGKKLVAYVVAGGSTGTREIRAHLQALLPEYMIPSQLHLLPAMPLNGNGKVDRKRLAASVPRRPAAPRAVALDTETEAVRAIWCELLGIDGCEPGDSFFDRGGDSLLAVALVGELEQAFSTRVEAHQVYEHPTLEGVVALVRAGVRGSSRNGSSPAGHASVAPDLRLVDDLVAGPRGGAGPAQSVLVTGASGFIGAHVVAELLRRDRATRLVLLQRGGDRATARRRVASIMRHYGIWDDDFAGRLEVLLGDLDRDDLGLRADEARRVAHEVDTVVHAGAVVHLLHDYAGHRPTNVLGTSRILHLAARGAPKTVHFLSSLSAFPDRSGSLCVVAEDDPPRADRFPARGYDQSKWAAETLVRQADRHGVVSVTYRLGDAMPHSTLGIPNQRSACHLLLQGCLRLGLYPSTDVRFDYSPVDVLARAIGARALAARTESETVHLFHPAGATLKGVMAAFASLGAGVEEVSVVDFFRALRGGERRGRPGERDLASLELVLLAHVERNAGHDEEAALARGLAAMFTSPRGRFSRASGDDWPPIGPALLKPYLDRMQPIRWSEPGLRADARIA